MKSIKTARRLATVIALVAGVLSAQTAKESPDARFARMLTYTTAERVDARVQEIDRRLADLERELESGHQAALNAIDAARDVNGIKASNALIQADSDMMAAKESLRLERKFLMESKQVIEATPVCRALFLSTIDKKTSDLTVRETETIATCKEMGVYNK